MNSFWPSYSRRRRHQPSHRPHGDVLVVVDDLGLVVVGDLPGGVEQEGAEDVEDPVELLDQRGAGDDEPGPQHERTEDAPEQHPELVLAGHREEAEDHRPHEDVVDRQATSRSGSPRGTPWRPCPGRRRRRAGR